MVGGVRSWAALLPLRRFFYELCRASPQPHSGKRCLLPGLPGPRTLPPIEKVVHGAGKGGSSAISLRPAVYPSTPLETLSSPGGSQGQCGVRRRVLPDMSAAAFETPKSGAGRRPGRPMASAPGLTALSGTGGLDPLILSTQPGEAFLSHSGDSTIRAPPGLRLGGSLWHRCFPRPWSPLQGEVGCGTEDGVPLGPPGTVCPSPASAPQGPQESLPHCGLSPWGFVHLPWGWPSPPALPLRGNWSSEESPHSFPSPGATVNS